MKHINEWTNSKCKFLVEYHNSCKTLKKQITIEDKYWVNLFINEIYVNDNLPSRFTNFSVPKVIDMSISDLIIWFEHKPIENDHQFRFERKYCDKISKKQLINICNEVSQVTPFIGIKHFSLYEWINKSIKRGILDEKFALLLVSKKSLRNIVYSFAHGDLIPSNLYCSASNAITLIDWEFAGMYPNHYDRAMVDIFQFATQQSENPIDYFKYNVLSDQLSYYISLLIIITREIRLANDIPDIRTALRLSKQCKKIKAQIIEIINTIDD